VPFPGYLSPAEIAQLVAKAIDADLITLGRPMLLQGIIRTFALGLRRIDNELDQFQLDLIKLNETERLADGQIPLVQFLRNAATQLRLRGRGEAEEFERAALSVSNRARGVPKLPDPRQLPEVQKQEAIVDVDDMVDYPFLAAGVAVGRSVARIVVPRFDNGVAVTTNTGAPWRMVGTAWMIGPGLALTNHHVINARTSEEPAASADDFARQGRAAVLEFDLDAAGSAVTTVPLADVVAVSVDLDYALLRLAADPGRAPLRLHPQRVVSSPATYLPVNIVQHPRGLPKRVAFRNNLVTAADASTIRYFTDTDFGSSGSPVCDDNWRVVALHRGAVFASGVTFQGKTTAFVNFGSQIQAVLDDLRARDAATHARVVAAQA